MHLSQDADLEIRRKVVFSGWVGSGSKFGMWEITSGPLSNDTQTHCDDADTISKVMENDLLKTYCFTNA